jgi:hypothetical protein
MGIPRKLYIYTVAIWRYELESPHRLEVFQAGENNVLTAEAVRQHNIAARCHTLTAWSVTAWPDLCLYVIRSNSMQVVHRSDNIVNQEDELSGSYRALKISGVNQQATLGPAPSPGAFRRRSTGGNDGGFIWQQSLGGPASMLGGAAPHSLDVNNVQQSHSESMFIMEDEEFDGIGGRGTVSQDRCSVPSGGVQQAPCWEPGGASSVGHASGEHVSATCTSNLGRSSLDDVVKHGTRENEQEEQEEEEEEEEVEVAAFLRWHDVEASVVFDPVSGKDVLMLVQTDVSSSINADLNVKKVRTAAL